MNFKLFITRIVTIGFAFMSTQLLAESPTLHYQLGMSQPHTHLFEVDFTVSQINKSENQLDFIMPVWRSGRYVILDFAGGVQEFTAYAGNDRNKKLPWSKVDKMTWRVKTEGQATVSISYKVYANEFNLRTRGLNDQHAFVDGSAVFMYIEKFRHQRLTLHVKPYGDWHVSTGLDRVAGKTNHFYAPSFDYLADCPLEIGNQQDFEFEVEGKKHYLSIFGEGNWDKDKLLERLRKVIETNFKFWGDLPYQHYTFMVHSAPGMGGGTEHINSTIMGINPFAFRTETGYDRFTSLSMHEFFHTWNVKQLRPAGINPYDFTKENYSPSFWISEGTTDYYTMLLMRRAGFYSVNRVLADLGNMIRNDRQRPGRTVQSLEESSFDAWVKFWKQSENGQNREVSYYDKGGDVSLLLDLEIRHRSENRGSLDRVLREMFKRFPLKGPGFSPEDFQKVVEEVGEGSFDEFFSKYVRGTAEIDFAKFFGYAGLEVQERQSNPAKPWLGIATREREGQTMITAVIAGSPAYEAGLNVGDELVALEGYRVRSNQVTDRLSDFNIDDSIRLTVFRAEQLREFQVKLQAEEIPEFTVKHRDNPTELQKKIYEDWLGAVWPGEEEK